MANPDTNGARKGQKLVIIGGVAGGASCAARARRLDETAEILLLQVRRGKLKDCVVIVLKALSALVSSFTDKQSGPDVSFASCGMPYFIGGEITDRNQVRDGAS